MDGTTNIIELKGIGEKSATAFGRLGIRDVDSLITMYPKYYLTYEDPKDVNVEQYIQIPWTSITQIGANVSGKRVSRHFEILTDKSKFLFASKDSGKILKIAREHLGNEKVVKLPTLIQTIGARIKGLFAKKS